MKNYAMRYLLLFILVLSLPRTGQAQVSVVWNRTYGSPRSEIGGYTVAMPTGGYLLLSGVEETAFPPPTLARFLYFVRTNAVGDTLWTKKMQPFRTLRPFPSGLAVDNTGNVLVTGGESSGNGYGFMIKLTPACDTIWTRIFHYTGPGNSTGSCDSPMLTPDGNYAALEYTALFGVGNTTLYDHYLTKINAITGASVWRVPFAGIFQANGFSSVNSYVTSVIKTSAGFLAFADGVSSAGIDGNPSTVVMDTGGNLIRFRTRRDIAPNSFPVAYATADGNVVVGRRQMATKLTPAGDTLWHTRVPRRLGRDWDAASLCEDAQGNYVVAGNSRFYIGGSQLAANVHLTRFRPRTGQVVNDTMLFRSGETYASTVLRTAAGRLLIGGWYANGPYGGTDAFLTEWSAFAPLAARAGATSARGTFQAYPNPAGAAGATLLLPQPSPSGGTLIVFDGQGRSCARQAVPPGTAALALPLAGLPPGLYLLRYEGRNGTCSTTHLVRE